MVTIAKSITSTIILPSGGKMPLFGLGCYVGNPDLEVGMEKVALAALKQGYRLLDTAQFYKNEAAIGNAVRNSGMAREEIFVVSKIMWEDHGREVARKSVANSLKQLDVGYIDLYLIHSPSGGHILDTYDVLVEYRDKGLIRDIGVSNFGVHHLEALKEAKKPTPAVNQIELHVWQQNPDLVTYCRERGIAVMGFSPMAKGRHLDHPHVVKMARSHGKSVAQVMIRWSVQSGFITIPKTSNVDRLYENAQVFDWELSQDDMKLLANIPPESVMRSNPTEGPWKP